jgi:glutathione S-transferase
MLKLYFGPNSCALAPHIALHEANAAFEPVRVLLREGQQNSPEYRAINPKGRVPALATDRGLLTETPAVLTYIAQTFPAAALAPLDDPFALAEMQSFNAWIASSLHIAFAHYFRPARYAEEETAHAAMKARVGPAVAEHFAVVEERLAEGPWVHGERYTTSDPYLYVMTRWLPSVGLQIADFPRAAEHASRMQARAAVIRALDDHGVAPV